MPPGSFPFFCPKKSYFYPKKLKAKKRTIKKNTQILKILTTNCKVCYAFAIFFVQCGFLSKILSNSSVLVSISSHNGNFFLMPLLRSPRSMIGRNPPPWFGPLLKKEFSKLYNKRSMAGVYFLKKFLFFLREKRSEKKRC